MTLKLNACDREEMVDVMSADLVAARIEGQVVVEVAGCW